MGRAASACEKVAGLVLFANAFSTMRPAPLPVASNSKVPIMMIIRHILFAWILIICGCAPLQSKPEEKGVPLGEMRVEFVCSIGRAGSGPGQFLRPAGLALSSESGGRVYAADTGNQRIQVFNVAGDYLFQFGRFGVGEGEFNEPVAIAIDGQLLAVADQLNHRIQQFDSRGGFVRMFGSQGNGNAQFNRPQGLAWDSWGLLYVADAGNDRVQRLDRYGDWQRSFGAFGLGAGFMRKPTAVCADTPTQIMVLEADNRRIQSFNEQGDFLGAFGRTQAGEGELREPQAMALASGLVFIADTGRDRLAIFTLDGRWVREVRDPGLARPAGVAADEDGNLWVADTGNSRLLKYKISKH